MVYELELEAAIRDGNKDKVKQYCERIPWWMREKIRGKFALEIAIEYGHKEIVSLLLEYGGETTLRNDDNKCLKIASEKGFDDIVNLLLDENANLDARRDEALIVASLHGRENVVETLLKRGANVHTQHEQAICNAAWKGHEKTVCLLLEHGANPAGDPSWTKNQPIKLAAKSGHLNVLSVLFSHSPNLSSICMLEKACEKGHLHIVEFFFELYATNSNKNSLEFNNQCSSLEDGLVIATKYGYVDIVKVFLRHGTSISRNAMRATVANHHTSILELFLQQKANVCFNDNELLRYASRTKYDEIVEMLLAHPLVDVHANDDEALRSAAKYGRDKIVRLLLDKGANVHAKHDQALRKASSRGHLKTVELLVHHNANLHAWQNEALRVAAENGHLEVVEYLLEKGARIHACGDQALKDAAANAHTSVAKFLIEKGADVKVLSRSLREEVCKEEDCKERASQKRKKYRKKKQLVI